MCAADRSGKSNIVQLSEQAIMLMSAADYRESLRAYTPRVLSTAARLPALLTSHDLRPA
jgi:hypothetical protein